MLINKSESATLKHLNDSKVFTLEYSNDMDDIYKILKNTIEIKKAKESFALSSGKIDKYKYFTGEKILPSNRRQIIEKVKFTYSPLANVLEKQTKKQVDAIKSLHFSNKTSESDQLKRFPQNQLNCLIIDKLKQINQLQSIIKSGKLDYKSKTGKNCF